jgi:cytochrome c2
MRSLLLLSITAIAAGLLIATGHSADAADAAQGEHAFAKCAVCHGIGLGLLGVIGRHAGSVIQRRKG